MELQFSITPEYTALKLAEQLELELRKDEEKTARRMHWLEHWHKKLLGPLLFSLLLVAGALAMYFPAQQITPGKIIATLVYTLILTLLWRRFSGQWLTRLRAGVSASYAKPRKNFRGTQERLIKARLHIVLKSIEGTYRLQLGDQGFVMINGKGAQSGLDWDQIVSFKENADFYFLACAKLEAKKQLYMVAKHSDLMEPEAYQQGLALLLEKCPIAPQPA